MSKKPISFTITLDEFYLDEEDNIQDALKDYIKGEVVRKIWSDINKKVEDQIQRDVKNAIEQEFTRRIGIHIDAIIKSDTPVLKNQDFYDERGQYVKKDITIEEHVRQKFLRDSGWGSPNETIKKLAEQFAKELKARYDVLFASQIVNKMNDQGLLKDEAIQQLLTK